MVASSKPAAKKSAAKPKVTDSHTKPKVRGAKPLTHGSDFAGLGTMSLAIKKLAKLCPEAFMPHHLFSCDNLVASEAFIRFTHNPVKFHKDILKRIDADLPDSLDLYSWTAPCQGLSKAGKQKGSDDPRTQFIFKSLEFISKVLPKAFVMENVLTLATHCKNNSLWQTILSQLTECSYYVEHNVVNSSAYLPQNRERLYLVGIRNDVKRSLTKGVPLFPHPPPKRILELSDIVQELPPSRWLPFPQNEYQKNNVVAAYKALPHGTNPFLVPVVIDAKASERFATRRVKESPALTKTRASQFGYWISTKAWWMSLGEMAAMQGYFGGDFPTAAAGISKSQAAGMLGNSQCLPLVQYLVAHTMYHACMLTHEQFIVMKARMYANWGL